MWIKRTAALYDPRKSIDLHPLKRGYNFVPFKYKHIFIVIILQNPPEDKYSGAINAIMVEIY